MASAALLDPAEICQPVMPSGAREVVARLGEIVEELALLPDEPGKRVHILFAKLYYFDMLAWLDRFAQGDPDGFFDRFSFHFFAAYERILRVCLSGEQLPVRSPWHAYQRLTRTARMSDSISRHLAIQTAGARAHICGDIGPSLAQTAQGYEAKHGRSPDPEQIARFFFDHANRSVFMAAGMKLIEHHQAHQSGYRKAVFAGFRYAFPRTSWIWWPVMRRWRRHSWNTAFPSGAP